MFVFARNGSLDVYLSDYLTLNYMRYKLTDCSLEITGDDFGTSGYSLGFSKELKIEKKVNIY